MAARRYEISLLVLKKYFTSEIPNGFTLIVFGVKGAIYYVAIAKVIFSHVKISSFRAKAHLVFHWCLYNNMFFKTGLSYMYCRVLSKFPTIFKLIPEYYGHHTGFICCRFD